MKRRLGAACLLAVLVAVLCAGCGNRLSLEDHTWTMTVAFDKDGQVVACAPGQKDLYPHAEAIELTFTAEHGRLTCSRENITGTYRQTETNPDGGLYELYVEGWGQGFGGCAYTKHATGETVPTFAVQFPERSSIYFTGE